VESREAIDASGSRRGGSGRQLRARYGEFAEIVLLFALRTYRHGGTEKLLALATAKAAA
jgi:hypothetical protein